MKVDSFESKSCCGGKVFTFKMDKPITQSLLEQIKNLGFTEQKHFTKSGILYVDSPSLIVTGPFGATKLQIKCRQKNCDENVNNFKALLIGL